MIFASNITVTVEADNADQAQAVIRKLVKGVEHAAAENGIDTLPYANYPVATATTSRERPLAAVEPEELFGGEAT